MKLNKFVKALPLVMGAGLCANANAGVVASSYLEINTFFVQIDTDNDLVADVAPADIGSFISIVTGTREGNTNANFDGVAAGDAKVDSTGVLTADADLVCVGPSCLGLGLANNGQTVDFGNLVADDTLNYAVSDQNVSGSALGAGASGFTYGDVGIANSDAIASAASAIFNNLTTTLTLTILNDINLRFTALYDVLVDAAISADITADSELVATASAEASFDIDLIDLGTSTTVLDDGLTFTDFAIDAPGLGDLTSFSENDSVFESAWVNLTAGSYQVRIAQDSDVQASFSKIPEPGTVALLGFGLLGLGLSRRRSIK